MAEYSSVLLEKAVDELSKLPGIGRKTALRLALHLLGEEKMVTDSLSQSLLNMRNAPSVPTRRETTSYCAL